MALVTPFAKQAHEVQVIDRANRPLGRWEEGSMTLEPYRAAKEAVV